MTTHRKLAAQPQARAERIFADSESGGASHAWQAGHLRAVVRALCNQLADYADADDGIAVEYRGVKCVAYVNADGDLAAVTVNGADVLELMGLSARSDVLEQIEQQDRDASDERAAEDQHYRRAA